MNEYEKLEKKLRRLYEREREEGKGENCQCDYTDSFCPIHNGIGVEIAEGITPNNDPSVNGR